MSATIVDIHSLLVLNELIEKKYHENEADDYMTYKQALEHIRQSFGSDKITKPKNSGGKVRKISFAFSAGLRTLIGALAEYESKTLKPLIKISKGFEVGGGNERVAFAELEKALGSKSYSAGELKAVFRILKISAEVCALHLHLKQDRKLPEYTAVCIVLHRELDNCPTITGLAPYVYEQELVAKKKREEAKKRAPEPASSVGKSILNKIMDDSDGEDPKSDKEKKNKKKSSSKNKDDEEDGYSSGF